MSFTFNQSPVQVLFQVWLVILRFSQPQLGTCFVVQLLNRIWLFVTSWTAARQAPLPFTISQSLLKFMSTELVMPSNHFILCCPFSFCPQSFPVPRYFPMSGLFSSVANYWSFSFSISPSNEYSGWFPLGLTGFISLQYKEHSRVFSSITVLKHQFFGAQPSLLPNSHIHTWLLERLLECITAFLKQQLQQSYFPVSHSEQTLS